MEFFFIKLNTFLEYMKYADSDETEINIINTVKTRNLQILQ